MIDVKKLTIGFLILATAGGASAFLVGDLGGPSATANTAIISAQATGAAPAPYAGNAFESQPTAGAGFFADTTDPSSTDAILNDPNNLTNTLASEYLNGLMVTNPDGPQTDANGNPVLTPPDPNSILTQFETTSTFSKIDTPDWDLEAAKIPIVVVASSSNAVTNYGAALASILNSNFTQTNLTSILSGKAYDPNTISFAMGKIQSALQDIAGLQTPTSLTGFQKSLLTMLVYEKNTLGLTATTSSDPLKVALTLQAEKPKYSAAVLNLQTQLEKIKAANSFSISMKTGGGEEPTSKVLTLISNALGIPVAHAQFAGVVSDPITETETTLTLTQILLQWADNILLEILKNAITKTMQNHVLKWVQGAGVPRIIQQWGTTLLNSYEQAALNTLNQQFACVNPTLLPSVKTLLTIPTPAINGGNNACEFQFQALLSGDKLGQFYNDFSNGGFATYLAMFQPGGNSFGAAMDIQDRSVNAGVNSQQAAQTKAIANQGWKGSQVCTDGSDPNGTHFVCPDGSRPSNAGQCFVVGQTPTIAAVEPNNGYCSDGSEPQVTSPGQVTGKIFGAAVDSQGNLTESDNNPAAVLFDLANAFVNSLLSQLSSDVVTAATGALP